MCKKVQWSSVLDTFDTGPQRLQQATKSFLSQVSFFCRRSRKLKQFVNHVRQDTGKTEYQRHINKISLNKMLTQPLTLGSLGRHTFQIVVGHTDRHTRLHNSAASTVQWCFLQHLMNGNQLIYYIIFQIIQTAKYNIYNP